MQAPHLSDEFVQTSEIIVPLAGKERHERALTLAQRLAERWGIPVHIVHIQLQDDPADSGHIGAARSAFRARHPKTGIRATLAAGDSVADAMAQIVPSTALIVMSSEHAEDGEAGSVAEGILRATGGPALVLGPKADHEHVAGPVIVALDGSPTSEDALDCAVAFAEAMGERIQLVQIVDPATTQHVARLRAEGQRVSESGHLQSVAARLVDAGHNAGWEVVHETNVVRGLIAAARRCGSGVIAIGTHGDTGLARRMLGSTAMGLVAASSQPVLVVKTGGRDELEISA